MDSGNPPNQPIRVRRRYAPVKGLRWRSSEERREARRKIEAIRRKVERQRVEAGGTRVDAAVLRSPKVVMGALLVLLALGALLASAVRKPAPSIARAPLEQARARRSLAVAAAAMTYYRVHTKGWPPQRLGLFALAKNYGTPGWKGPYINWAYKDPWGAPYVYRMPLSPFEAPELFSCGPDGKPDTPDDIRAQPEDFVCPEGTWRREADPEPPVSENTTP